MTALLGDGLVETITYGAQRGFDSPELLNGVTNCAQREISKYFYKRHTNYFGTS